MEFLASTMAAPVALIALLVVAIVLLVLFIWSIRSHRDPALQIDCDAPLADLMPSLAGLTQSSIYGGNSVELYENGAFFDVMFDEIRAATRTVHFETLLWKEGWLGQRLMDALVECRRAGVTVRVLVDGDGGKMRRSPRGSRRSSRATAGIASSCGSTPGRSAAPGTARRTTCSTRSTSCSRRARPVHLRDP